MSISRALAGKLNVFISYSRDDIAFADQLIAALALTECATTIDRQGIFGGEDWKRRLSNLIRDADTVVFVLSPSSARSTICAWEAEEATRLGKRIIPVLCHPIDDIAPPPHLSDLNYIYFYSDPKVPGSGFGTGQVQLVAALATNIDWIRDHTRLQQRASEWQTAHKPQSRLLFGESVSEALSWLDGRPASAPEPSGQLREYIRTSEDQEKRRVTAETRYREEIAALTTARTEAESQRDSDRRSSAKHTRQLVALMVAGFCTAVLFATLAGSLGYMVMQKKHEIEAQRASVLKQASGAGGEIVAMPDDNGKVGGGDGPGATPIGIGWKSGIQLDAAVPLDAK